MTVFLQGQRIGSFSRTVAQSTKFDLQPGQFRSAFRSLEEGSKRLQCRRNIDTQHLFHPVLVIVDHQLQDGYSLKRRREST